MKACPGPHCGWLFYDASRNSSSTWCSMAICGNRTKTAAYRKRRRGSDVRSAWFVVGLAARRLRRRDSGALVTALGLAVATTVLAGVLAGVTIATDRSTAQAIERIPSSARSVRAVLVRRSRRPQRTAPVLDEDVNEAFSGIGLEGPTPIVLYRGEHGRRRDSSASPRSTGSHPT
jgi:hypothetical protein